MITTMHRPAHSENFMPLINFDPQPSRGPGPKWVRAKWAPGHQNYASIVTIHGSGTSIVTEL